MSALKIKQEDSYLCAKGLTPDRRISQLAQPVCAPLATGKVQPHCRGVKACSFLEATRGSFICCLIYTRVVAAPVYLMYQSLFSFIFISAHLFSLSCKVERFRSSITGF